MTTETTPRALTVRLPADLYAAAAALARQRRQSINALLQDSLTSTVRTAEDHELYEAFQRFGGHPDGDVTYADQAQAELAMAVEVADGP